MPQLNWMRLVRYGVLAVALVGVLALILYPRTKVAYLAYRLERADTAQEERAAFALMNRWSPHGTSIALLDADGHNLGPEGKFDCARVHSVRITWPSGREVKRRVLDDRNLVLLLAE